MTEGTGGLKSIEVNAADSRACRNPIMREEPLRQVVRYCPGRDVQLGRDFRFRQVGSHISPRKRRISFCVLQPGRFVFPLTSCEAHPFVRPIAAPISSSVKPRRAHSEVNRSINCLS